MNESTFSETYAWIDLIYNYKHTCFKYIFTNVCMKACKTKHAEWVFPVCKSHHIIVTDKSIT